MLYARIVLPLAQPPYTYAFDESLGIGVGDAVAVQFGARRYYTGIVWEITTERPSVGRIKEVCRRLYGVPLVGERQRRLWEWVADYYMCTLGEVMRIALPSAAKPSADSFDEFSEEIFTPRRESYVALCDELRRLDAAAFEAQAEELSRRAPRRLSTLRGIARLASERKAADGFVPRRLLDADAGQIATLRSRGLIVVEQREVAAERIDRSDFLLPQLSDVQQRALDQTLGAFDERKPALLWGVTGSGKTEIYMHLMARTLARGGSVLMLVPEIVMTSQLIERIETVFPSRVTAYHSKLTPRRRTEAYLRLAASAGGEIVIGVRSSIFLPLPSPDLLIVDEEHDASYKQTDMQPRYNARDCAVMIARQSGASIVLGSATPSLESYVNGLAGKYRTVRLDERYGGGEPCRGWWCRIRCVPLGAASASRTSTVRCSTA